MVATARRNRLQLDSFIMQLGKIIPIAYISCLTNRPCDGTVGMPQVIVTSALSELGGKRISVSVDQTAHLAGEIVRQIESPRMVFGSAFGVESKRAEKPQSSDPERDGDSCVVSDFHARQGNAIAENEVMKVGILWGSVLPCFSGLIPVICTPDPTEIIVRLNEVHFSCKEQESVIQWQRSRMANHFSCRVSGPQGRTTLTAL